MVLSSKVSFYSTAEVTTSKQNDFYLSDSVEQLY